MTDQPKRHPVDFDYQGLNLVFLKWLAKIPVYATEKYGSWSQYTNAPLVGEKSCINHIYEHLRQYQMGESYDHFDGDSRWHLVATAYNAMMQFFYHTKFGFEEHPLHPVVASDSCPTKNHNTNVTLTVDSPEPDRVALALQKDLQRCQRGRTKKPKTKTRQAKPSQKRKPARGRIRSRKG
jgi:hypothetical protein